jgi:hypothetical protein
MWLVNAYNAVGDQAKAEGLCEKLLRHPDLETRRQAKNLLYILKAPQLKRPGNWMTQIPDLGAIANDPQAVGYTYKVAPKAPPRKRPMPEPEPIDPSQINTRDNGFLWLLWSVWSCVRWTMVAGLKGQNVYRRDSGSIPCSRNLAFN